MLIAAYIHRMSARKFRYSTASFRSSVFAALGLTAIVSFLVWLFAQLFGYQHYNVITLVSGMIFFGFCSAAMIWRYMRNDTILAVRPDGLFDARYSSQAIPWDEIKDIRLGRVENEFQLTVVLWPKTFERGEERPAFIVDLAPLDGGIEQVLAAMQEYKPVSIPNGA